MNDIAEQVFDKYIQSKGEIKPQSVQVYRTKFLKLLQYSNGEPFWLMKQNDILPEIKKDNDYSNLIRMLVSIRAQEGKPVKTLVREMEKQKVRKLKSNKVKTAEIVKQGPTLDELNNALTELEGPIYIMLFLMLNFGVRNKDMIVKIDKDKTANTMIKRKNEIVYTRRDYKTAGVYGTKSHRIRDRKFTQEYNKLVGDREEGYLFMNSRSTPLTDVNISQFITRQLNKKFPGSNLTQAKIFKIVNNSYRNNEAIQKYEKLMANRGHSHITNTSNYS